jgi:replication factor C small subunit
MIKSKNIMNLIFYGSPGTGKTTCAHLIANLSDLHLLPINASLSNSVVDIRNEVEKYATSGSLFGKTKIVLLDESDYLSKNAQASLRSLIEKTIGNCRFILTANVLSKIQEPLQSRCRPFCFEVPLSSINESIEKLIQTIKNRLQELNFEIDESKIRQIVVLKFPDYRAIANEIEFEFL